MEVVISTSNLNSYGSRVLTEGIDIEQYMKNPIVLWMHNRPYGDSKDEPLPIGKMTNLRKEDDKLIGNIEFDQKDDFARKIESKYDDGILSMVSAGLDVLELSDDKSTLVEGQTRMTITKSRLREVSCVDIGANDDCLKLYYNNTDVQMQDELDRVIPMLNMKENKNKEKSINKMKEVMLTLGLKQEAEEKEAVQAIKELQAKAEKADGLEKEFAKMKEERVKEMVEKAVKEGKIQADKREVFVSIGKTNGEEVLKETLEAMVSVPDVKKSLKKESTNESIEISAKMWDKLDKEGGLMELKRQDKETFDKLFEKKFGK